jgi:sodium/bile acid cotransporter 7
MYTILKRYGIDYFIIALGLMVLLAYWFPLFGTSKAWYAPANVSVYGVAFIFFFYGLKLSPQQLKSGLSNIRLHIVVQLSTFVLFPLIAFLLKPILSPINQPLWEGIFFMAAIPSTVSSSVVMVGIAKGNIPGAIFNASISSMLGLVITPLLVGLVLSSSNNAGMADIHSIIIKLLWQVVVPVIAGIILHPYWGKWVSKHLQTLKYFDQLIILLIVFTSFSESFESGVFAQTSLLLLVLLSIGLILLLGTVYRLIEWICRFLNFNREDTITTIFCGSKKSLVHGMVFSKILFPVNAAVGMMILPLMLYHAIQLVVISMIAQRKSKEVE